MEVAKGAVRPRFVTAHPAALAARNSQGQLALTEPQLLVVSLMRPSGAIACAGFECPAGTSGEMSVKLSVDMGHI